MCVRVRASAPEWMFVYMGERGWQGYNLLQTACGQRRGGRDSDTEREQGMERARGGEGREGEGRKRGGGRTRKGKKWGGREGRNTDRKEKTRREGGELRAEWIGAAYECSTVPTVLFPLPPIVIPGSVGASEAANSSDIYAAFSALQWRKPGRSLCQHPPWPQVDKRWWMVRDDGPLNPNWGPSQRGGPLETLSEPRSCILCYIIQYVLNKIGLVWVEE